MEPITNKYLIEQWQIRSVRKEFSMRQARRKSSIKNEGIVERDSQKVSLISPLYNG